MIKHDQIRCILVILLVVSITYPVSATPSSCNCVIFRFDDVQSHYLRNVQIKVMDTFQQKNASLTIGIIGYAFYQDSTLVSYIKQRIHSNNPPLEIANHGWKHEDFTKFSEIDQATLMASTNDELFDVLGVTPSVFITPFNRLNNDTIQAANQLHFRVISSSIYDDKNNYFIANGRQSDNVGQTIYHLPSMVDYKRSTPSGTWIKVPINSILNTTYADISKYGYSVILLHPENFAQMQNGKYVDNADDKEIEDLIHLIDTIKSENIKITSFSDIIGLQSQTYPSSIINTDYPVDYSCHCVAFRLDDIQDYWLNNVQTAIIDTFKEKNSSLTLGIIGNYFGNDVDLVTHIKEKMKDNSSKIEIANHGWNHEDFTKFSREMQSTFMKNTNEKISNTLGVKPSVFIAPFDAINSDTMEAFLENNFQYISANTTEDPPQYLNKNMAVYHLPETAKTGDQSDNDTYWYSENYKQTFVEITDSLQKYGYAVVMMHPFEYSIRHGMSMENKVDWNQIHQLELLIDKIKQNNLKIVTISDIPKHISNQNIPVWTSNLFTWYNEGQISETEVYTAFNYLLDKKIIYL